MRNFKLRQTLAALLLLLPLSVIAQSKSPKGGGSSSSSNDSGGSGGHFLARAQAREQNRWTLSEWLEQRDRGRMMDLWLSLHSPSPYEFMLGGASVSSKATSSTTPNTSTDATFYSGTLSAYAQFVGLTLEHQNNTPEQVSDTTGLLNIRLLGNSLQNSSFTLSVGQRSRTLQNSGSELVFKNSLGQVGLQVYITKYFGLEGSYRAYQSVRVEALSQNIGGVQSEGGLFIDFAAFRIFGTWFKDTQESTDSNNNVILNREGLKGGFKIFY